MSEKVGRRESGVSRRILAGVAISIAAISGCSSGGGVVGGTDAQVQIMKDSGVGHYHPGVVEIGVGGSVIWTNRSGVAHNVVFEEPSVSSSGLFNDGETFEAVFDRSGEYRYVCTLHPTMKGIVKVQ
jgi:plastocyanin